MNNIYKMNKFIFNKLIKNKYNLQKDKNDKTILYINTSEHQIKCEYIFFLVYYKKNNLIQWSDNNEFIDKKTQKYSSIIRKYLSNINDLIENNLTQSISNENLNKIMQNLIKNNVKFKDNDNNDEWNCNWILRNENKDKEEYVEYYMITKIIYF
jgi:hypothetical protein